MIKPTVGRVVWFYAPGVSHESEPNAAIVAKVWSDTMVNLAVFDANGVSRGETSVLLVQGEGSYGNPGGGAWCCWMPYQKGQAAKTEALEAALREPDKTPSPFSGGGPGEK